MRIHNKDKTLATHCIISSRNYSVEQSHFLVLEATWYSLRKQWIILTSRCVGDYNTSSEVQQVCPTRWREPEERIDYVYDINRITSIVHQCWLHLNPNVNDLENSPSNSLGCRNFLKIYVLGSESFTRWLFKVKDHTKLHDIYFWKFILFGQNNKRILIKLIP